ASRTTFAQAADAPPAAPTATPERDPAANVAKQLKINIAWQVSLEAADFSPGIFDGVFKRKGVMALTEYAARFFPGLSPYDAKVYQALAVDVDHSLVLYSITSDDAAQVGGLLPDDWNEKATYKRLNYEDL